MKKNLKWFAAALLFAALAVPATLTAESPEPPCPNCKPGGFPGVPSVPPGK